MPLKSILSTLPARLTYANVVATLALFVALSGGTYAAATIPATSRSTPSAHAAKSKVKRGPRGRRGPRGHKGTKGDSGATGARGATGLRGASGTAGVAGSARGYAYVRADGTLDATRSKGVIDISRRCNGAGCSAAHGVGIQCFNLSFTPKSVVATAEDQGDSADATLDPSVPSGTPGCPDGYRDADALTIDSAGSPSNGAFFVTFN